MLITKYLTIFGRYIMLMGRTFSRPERMRMFLKQYVKEMAQLGVNSIGIVLLILLVALLGVLFGKMILGPIRNLVVKYMSPDEYIRDELAAWENR